MAAPPLPPLGAPVAVPGARDLRVRGGQRSRAESRDRADPGGHGVRGLAHTRPPDHGVAVRHRRPVRLERRPGDPVRRLHRGALRVLRDHRFPRALPELGAVRLQHRVHDAEPRSRIAARADADVQPPHGPDGPVAVVGHPRRRRAPRVHRRLDLLPHHRGRAAQARRAGQGAGQRRDQAAGVHLRTAAEPGPPQPEHVPPPARHHQRSRGARARPRRPRRALPARPPRHAGTPQRREPPGALRRAAGTRVVGAGAAARRRPRRHRRDRGPRAGRLHRRRAPARDRQRGGRRDAHDRGADRERGALLAAHDHGQHQEPRVPPRARAPTS